MSFDNLMGYILSIPMCMQNFITIFHSVQEIGPFSLFQNLELGKPRRMKNDISQFLGLDLVNINVYAGVYQNIPLSSRDKAIFTFFRIWCSAKPRQMINVILQQSHFFQNWNLGKNSTNLKCLLTISWGTSCQYQCVCKISSQYSTQFKR